MTDNWIPKRKTIVGPVYRAILQVTESDICSGILSSGALLPPQGEAADRPGGAQNPAGGDSMSRRTTGPWLMDTLVG